MYLDRLALILITILYRPSQKIFLNFFRKPKENACSFKIISKAGAQQTRRKTQSGNKAVLVDPRVHLNDSISITSLTIAGGALSYGQEKAY